MTPEAKTGKGRGRPRRAGGAKLPSTTIRLSRGGAIHIRALQVIFPGSNQSMLLRTAFDIAAQYPTELEKEIKRGFEDHGPLGVFRSALGLANLTCSSPVCEGVASFRMEPEQHAQYRATIGQQSPTLVLEASLRLFRRKAEDTLDA